MGTDAGDCGVGAASTPAGPPGGAGRRRDYPRRPCLAGSDRVGSGSLEERVQGGEWRANLRPRAPGARAPGREGGAGVEAASPQHLEAAGCEFH